MRPDDTFSNEVLDVAALPRLDESRFEPLDPAFLRLRAVGGAVVSVLTIAAATWVAVVGTPPVRVVALLAAVTVVVVSIIRYLGARRMGYLVREHDLSVRTGVVALSVATVPFARVQHVAINRGPIERLAGLSSLQVRTAGGFVAVPGLQDEQATRLKQLVAGRAGEAADAERLATGEGPGEAADAERLATGEGPDGRRPDVAP